MSDADIGQAIAAATGARFEVAGERPIGGGCIHNASRLDGRDGRRFFVKRNVASDRPLFEAEADGLRALAGAGVLRVPHAVACGTDAAGAFLVLEWIGMGRSAESCAASLGEALAALHLRPGERYGWAEDNFIGRTPQPNGWSDDWIGFYRERRLGAQFALARADGHARLARDGERLMERLPRFFEGYAPPPSLLHGDLWGGNAACADGEPVVFDPAVYFGDAEADLAMTELFGGFGREFHAAYRAHRPVDAGYRVRRDLYNLYHVLNHAHLFGGSYVAQAERMTATLIAAAG